MAITVKFFASLRERVGRESVQLAYREGLDADEVWRLASDGLAMPTNTIVAVNMEYATRTAQVRDGDEVAFFPPVTGGER